MPESQPSRKLAPAQDSWLRRFARFLLAHQNARRSAMFYLLATALAFVVVGGILVPGWLRARPFILFAFWLVCALLTLTALVLAFFDLILVRMTWRVGQRTLREQYRIEDDPR